MKLSLGVGKYELDGYTPTDILRAYRKLTPPFHQTVALAVGILATAGLSPRTNCVTEAL